MRAAWRVLLADERDRQAAYALEAVVIEVVFVGGPLLLSVFLAFAPPIVPLVVTAVLLGAGGAGYARTRAARSWRPEPHHEGPGRRGSSPLRSVGVVAAMLVGLLLAIGFGQLDVSLAATAELVLGDQAKVGLLFMAIAGGSAVGGTVYGARVWPGREQTRLPVVLGVVVIGLGVVATLISRGVDSLPVLMPVLFLTGLSIAPGLIVIANLIDRFASRDRLGEAQAWLSTAFTAGGGAGTALAGVLIDRGGPARSLVGAVAAMLAAALFSLAAQRIWTRR
jgi:predicted MFS family arabinose efflux permease